MRTREKTRQLEQKECGGVEVNPLVRTFDAFDRVEHVARPHVDVVTRTLSLNANVGGKIKDSKNPDKWGIKLQNLASGVKLQDLVNGVKLQTAKRLYL